MFLKCCAAIRAPGIIELHELTARTEICVEITGTSSWIIESETGLDWIRAWGIL